MKLKELDYKEYEYLFNAAIDNNTVITTQDKKEELVIEDEETWKQCYEPTDEIRKQLPKFWFVSDKGNLISVYKKKAYWLKKDEFDGRYSYHFNIITDDGRKITKNIECHNLVRIVFGGLSYGKAEQLLNEQGIFAFGVKNSDELKLNGHHMGAKEDNSPESIELVTTDAHKIIDKIPKKHDSETTQKFLVEFGKMAREEEPNRFSILLTGQKVDKDTLELLENDGFSALYGTDNILLSKRAMLDLAESLIKNVKEE